MGTSGGTYTIRESAVSRAGSFRVTPGQRVAPDARTVDLFHVLEVMQAISQPPRLRSRSNPRKRVHRTGRLATVDGGYARPTATAPHASSVRPRRFRVSAVKIECLHHLDRVGAMKSGRPTPLVVDRDPLATVDAQASCGIRHECHLVGHVRRAGDGRSCSHPGNPWVHRRRGCLVRSLEEERDGDLHSENQIPDDRIGIRQRDCHGERRVGVEHPDRVAPEASRRGKAAFR